MESNEIQCALLHVHSEFSSYDGMGHSDGHAKRAKSLGMNSLALTDHGSPSGLPNHYFACEKEGVKPILGIEAYHSERFEPSKEMKRYHLTLLAKNIDGYYSIAQMSTDANLYNFYRYPICDFELLEKYNNGVICLSGCVLGMLSQTILHGSFDQAKIYTEKLLEIYRDNFFFEVQPQEFDDQKRANDGILKLADIYKRPLVMTSDSHYANPEDLDSYVILRKLNYHMPKILTEEEKQKKREREEKKAAKLGIVLEQEEITESDDMFKTDLEKFSDWSEGIKKQYEKLYMPSGRELADRWFALMGTNGEEYVRNSQMIADLCNVELKFPELVPKAYTVIDATGQPIESKQILATKVREGLIKMGKWNETAAREVVDEHGKTKIEIYRPYYERVVYELKRILEKHMEDYFLLVADLVEEARRRDIAVGPGRGSGGASLVARAIGITEIDPIKEDCMFDRFLPEHKKNLPDIDLDFGPSYRRDELFDYMIQKYNGKASQICNINTLTRSSLINDLAKELQIPDDIRDAMKQLIHAMYPDMDKDKSILPVYEDVMRNQHLAAINEKYGQVIKHFCKLYGNMRGYSAHASGLAISSGNLSQYAPLFVRAKKTYTAYPKKMLEKLNVVKIDILGLDAIAMVHNMCKMTGINRLDIPLNDKKVYKMFADLDITGIFQFDTPSATPYLKAVAPESINELAVCTGLNRPGSSETHALQKYVDAKKGKIRAVSRIDQLLADCCYDTHGALIFQEHVLTACLKIGGMSGKGANDVMKTLHGNNHKEEALPQEFIQGAIKTSGLTEDEAWELYQKLTNYTFNKAHAIAYVMISYWMMWFKCYHPFEYYLSILQLENDENKRKTYEIDAYRHKVLVLLPHVNGARGYQEVIVQGTRCIRGGLSSIDKVGPVAARAIEEEWKKNGDFTDEEDLLRRVNGTHEVTKGRGENKVTTVEFNKSPIKTDTLTALREAGALEFEFKIYKERCANYLSSLNSRKKRKWA